MISKKHDQRSFAGNTDRGSRITIPGFLNGVWFDIRSALDRTAYTNGTRAGRRALPTPRLSADSRRTVFSTVEVSPKSEPRGGRWEEAESPQLPQTHSLFGNRKRKGPLASPDGSGKKPFSFKLRSH